jgi:hypothetical protein
VREVAPFVLLACACGAAVTQAAPPPAPPPPVETTSPTPSASVGTSVDTFDDLAALRSTLAPGMSEIARRSTTGDAVDLLPAAVRDTCLRVAFASEAPVIGRLVDGTGAVLASTGPSVQGSLGERGPVCVRKGDVVRASAEGTGKSHVRWLAWQAP